MMRLRPFARARMLALIQRVSRAQVDVEGETVGRIGPGLLALVCAEPGDDDARVVRMAEKLLAYRVFGDDNGRIYRFPVRISGRKHRKAVRLRHSQ